MGVLGQEAARLRGEQEAPRLQVVSAWVWHLLGPRAAHPGCVMRHIRICAQAPLGSRDESGLVGPWDPSWQGKGPRAGPRQLHVGLGGVPGPSSTDSHRTCCRSTDRGPEWPTGAGVGRHYHRRKCTQLTEQGRRAGAQGNRGTLAPGTTRRLRGWEGGTTSLAPQGSVTGRHPVGSAGVSTMGLLLCSRSFCAKAPVPTMHITVMWRMGARGPAEFTALE